MPKLSPQVLFALVGVACLLVIYLFYNFAIKPKQDEITTLQSDLSTKQTTLSQYRSNVAAIPGLEASITKLETEKADFIRALPLTADFGQVVDQIRKTVSANKADLQQLTFSLAGASPDLNLPAGVRPMNVSLSVNGEYGKQFRILQSLETQNRFTNIKNLSLSLPQELSLDPKLGGKVDLVVYTFDPNLAAPVATPGTTPGAAPAAGAPAPAAPAPAGGTK